MKALFFDAGPVISLAMNNLLWILPDLQKQYGGSFGIVPAVSQEVIERPFTSKHFKFESLQVQALVRQRVLTNVTHKEIPVLGEELLDIANNCFYTNDTYLQIVHPGEMQTLAAALLTESPAVVVDERTTRMLMEDPSALKSILSHKLERNVQVDASNINEFIRRTKTVKVLRSVELALLAYERGLLDTYLPQTQDPYEDLLEAILWALKLSGCALSVREIDEIMKFEKKNFFSRQKLLPQNKKVFK